MMFVELLVACAVDVMQGCKPVMMDYQAESIFQHLSSFTVASIAVMLMQLLGLAGPSLVISLATRMIDRLTD
jgi:hypothetical protein